MAAFDVSIGTTSTQILAANAARINIEGLRHTGTQRTIYLGFGAAASVGQGVRLLPNQGLPDWFNMTASVAVYGIALEGTGDTISGIEN